MRKPDILGIIASLVVVCPTAWAQKTVRLSIATGGTGGVFYPLGGGMAKIISKNIPYAEATAEVTTASVDNCKLLGVRKTELALVSVDAAVDAYRGTGMFKEKLPLRTIAVVFQNSMHIVSLGGKGITKLSDLKGKRVSIGSPGGATEVWTLRILEAQGLDPNKDIKKERLGAAESAGALKDGKVDAYFFGGGYPTSSITDVAASPGLKMVLIPHDEVIPKMREKNGPIYSKGIIPEKTYPGQETAVAVSIAWVLFLCHEKMDEKVVYDVTRTLFEFKSELVAIHPEARHLRLETQAGESPLPFHPGAMRYYKEKGLAVK
jgi:hypothetical protein